MMIDPTLVVTMTRLLLPGSLPALEFSGAGRSPLEIVGYSAPATQSRNRYAPPADGVHGDELLSTSLQQSILGLDFRSTSDTETEVQAAHELVTAAILQFTFTIITEVSSAPAQAWRADPGAIQLRAGVRSYADMANLNPVYALTIPVYPIPGGVG